MRGSDRADLRDRLEYLGLNLVLAACRGPNRAWSRRAGLALGTVAGRAVPLRRRVALENLRHAFPESSEDERLEIYRGLFRNLGVVLGDFSRLVRMSHRDLLDRIEIDHPEHLLAGHTTGRGALLLTAHFGNWELLGASVRALGAPLTMLGARQRNPLVERLFSDYRSRLDIQAVTVRQGLRPVVRAFRDGGLVASLADQDGGRDGWFLDFLGRPASVQPGLFRLAARVRVPIVTGFSIRTGDGWRAEIQAPIEPEPATGDAAVEEEARRLAGIYTARVERYVRAHPDHWFWVHRRWKTRPPGELEGDSTRTG